LFDTHGGAAAHGLRRHLGLPPAVIAAMLHHPQPRVRGALASYPPVDPGVRERLLADRCGGCGCGRSVHRGSGRCPDDALVRLRLGPGEFREYRA
jgi:hypothetical protein